jgi:hypothetical protein
VKRNVIVSNRRVDASKPELSSVVIGRSPGTTEGQSIEPDPTDSSTFPTGSLGVPSTVAVSNGDFDDAGTGNCAWQTCSSVQLAITEGANCFEAPEGALVP